MLLFTISIVMICYSSSVLVKFANLQIENRIFCNYCMDFLGWNNQKLSLKNYDYILNFWMHAYEFGWNCVQSSICGFVTPTVVANARLLKFWNKDHCSMILSYVITANLWEWIIGSWKMRLGLELSWVEWSKVDGSYGD